MSLSNQFRNLRVRTKLYLFLLVPLITMLSLIGISISDKYQEKSQTEQIHQFITVVFDLADLVHSLQKERGLSAGFIGSNGKLYREELDSQRLHSDEQQTKFRNSLSSFDPATISWEMDNRVAYILTELERLPEVRNQVDYAKKDAFNYYSNTNGTAISIANQLQANYKDSDLNLLGELFNLLMELQERAGQERALLNLSFSQQQFNLNQFQAVSTAITLQREAINRYLSSANTVHANLLKKQLEHPVEAKVEALRAAAFNKWERNELLNKIHSLIGYGGLIHDFKNYVIRGTPFYYERFNRNLITTQQALSRFRNIGGIGDKELAHVDIIKETLLRYQYLLDTVTEMHGGDASVVAIDKAVKVDDTPALNAIAALRSDISTLDTSSWWSSTTKRIDLFKTISNSIRTEIIQHIKQHQSAVTNAFYLYITIMLFVIITTLLLAHLLINRLAKETSQIALSMHQMHQSGKFGALPVQGGGDEIGEIVSAFNTLVEKRDQAEAEQLKTQHRLLDTQKMNTLYKLSGGVAHNFNNMLAAILGYSSMAMSHKDVENSEKVKGYLNNINRAVERASALVEKIITYSEADTRIREESTLLGEMTEVLIKEQQSQLPSTIHLNHQIDADLPSVRIDLEQFKQIFEILFINAREAISNEGVIDIHLQLVTLTGEHCSACREQLDGRYMEFSIQDNGIGIDNDTIEHIFEPFFTTKDLSEGAGMGLAIAYGLIRKNSGHSIIESTPGEGTKFRVLLPIAS